jgi:hypothetical protein
MMGCCYMAHILRIFRQPMFLGILDEKSAEKSCAAVVSNNGAPGKVHAAVLLGRF